MKLNIKALLPLAIYLVGSANCTSTLMEQRNELAGTIQSTMNFEESLMMALNHPAMFDDKYETLDKWTKYLHDNDPAKKKEREETIAVDKAFKFYRLDLDESEIEILSKFLADNPKASDLNDFGSDSSSSEGKLKTKIEEQFETKKKYLERIMENLPIVKDIKGAASDSGINDILKTHIDAFIANALVFDPKRFTFANLHKVLESIKGAVEVPRKAKHAGEAAIEALEKGDKYEIVRLNSKPDSFKIKREKTEEEKKEKTAEEKAAEEKAKLEKEKQINLITFALDAADKSTSDGYILFYTVSGGLLFATALLILNAVTVKNETEDKEAEHDEESGDQ